MTDISEAVCKRLAANMDIPAVPFLKTASDTIRALRAALTRAEQQRAGAEAACQVQIDGNSPVWRAAREAALREAAKVAEQHGRRVAEKRLQNKAKLGRRYARNSYAAGRKDGEISAAVDIEMEIRDLIFRPAASGEAT